MPKTNEELARALFPQTPTQKLSRSLGIDHKFAETLLNMTKQDGRAHWKQPTEEEAGRWADEAMRKVRERFGTKTDAVLEKAKEMIAQHPELQKALEVSRFGSQPGVVLELSEAASRQLEAEAAKAKG